MDVALAFALAISAFAIQGVVGTKVDKQAEDTTYRFYRIFIHALIAVALLVMLTGNRIVWANCATGFIWRTWLLLYILPWWLVAIRRTEIHPLDSGSQPLAVRPHTGKVIRGDASAAFRARTFARR